MTVNVKTNNSGKSLAEIGNVSNPNLLINPDFKINQRGQNTYSISTGSGYTVDRWKLWNGSLIVNADGTVTFKNVSGQASSLIQILENPCNEECMLSMYVTNLTGVGYIYGSDSSDKVTRIITLTKGLNFIKLSSCAAVSIKLVPDTVAQCSITIKYTKLEKGTNVTQFVSPDIVTELTKCQRYYQIISLDTKTCLINESNVYSRIYGINMRNPTTILFNNSNRNIMLGSNLFKIKSCASSNIDYESELYLTFNLDTNTGVNSEIGIFWGVEICVDAEIY